MLNNCTSVFSYSNKDFKDEYNPWNTQKTPCIKETILAFSSEKSFLPPDQHPCDF